jgi:hypothetical protein
MSHQTAYYLSDNMSHQMAYYLSDNLSHKKRFQAQPKESDDLVSFGQFMSDKKGLY